MQWSLVVPVKRLARAKSRLSDTADDAVRPELALAFALDTVAAALSCPAVADVAVVTDDSRAGRELAALGAGVVADEPGGGLNAALVHAAAAVRAVRPGSPVAA
ncbi:2-phospho-L-lactate guanylyltransferase, partial [Streptomyces sp. TRM76130]|nr:2-phospho-L-lactate guanylyltransferase [Streptomyces sp. TRM76130]